MADEKDIQPEVATPGKGEDTKKSVIPTKESMMKNKYMMQNGKKPYVYKDPIAKRYRKKLIANFLVALSVICLIIIVVIAYLGSIVGNYTIQLQRNQTYLTMSETYDFAATSSRLRAGSVQASYPCDVNKLPSDDVLDANVLDAKNASHNGTDAGNGGTGVYLAYTFYIQNVGSTKVGINYNISIEKINQSIDNPDYPINECIRVRVYENKLTYEADGVTIKSDANQNHAQTTYAKKTNTPVTIGGVEYTAECVGDQNGYGVCSGTNDYRATEFYSTSYILYVDAKPMEVGEILRYTVVIWIEGNDPECTGNPPSGSGIELAMEYNFAGTYDSNGILIPAESARKPRADYFENTDMKYF